MKLTIDTELKTITVTGEFKPDELQKLVKSAGLEEYSVFAGEKTGISISGPTSSGTAFIKPFPYNANPTYVNSRLTTSDSLYGTGSCTTLSGITLTNSMS